MAITLFYLANNNEILSKVREEIDSVAERGQMLEFEDVNKLVYMQMVIKECMRVKPPVRGVGRVCAKDNVSVNGLNIPKGADIFIPIMALHHDSRHWDKPEVFNPERFSSGSKVKSFSYLPFMAGPRSCIGKNFAMLEAKMIISRVVQEFDIENPYTEITDLETHGLITARPLDGVKLKLNPRFIS
ncbi:cytochrome P450 3A16-like [Bolinopsis microptera]|uniref:cytochrome P450 3A16-like n=1 Tax=Bolinopsis microptera TaxID=2820187 RepID=UPI003078ED1F